MSRLKIAATLGTAAMVAGTVSAMGASGTALGVKPQAAADTAGAIRELTVGADVFIGDQVTTGPKGQVQIKFSDNTELVVGPNSALLIEDYLLRGDQSAGKFVVNALSGTFRFATGDAGHDKYLIKTPTGTIGVRGTEFDFTVDGTTDVLLYNGAVVLCDVKEQCVTLDNSCDIGQIDMAQSQVLGNVDKIFGKQRNDLRQSFLYARTQMPLLSEFRFEDALACFSRAMRLGPPADSLLKGTGSDSAANDCEYYGYGGNTHYCDYDPD